MSDEVEKNPRLTLMVKQLEYASIVFLFCTGSPTYTRCVYTPSTKTCRYPKGPGRGMSACDRRQNSSADRTPTVPRNRLDTKKILRLSLVLACVRATQCECAVPTQVVRRAMPPSKIVWAVLDQRTASRSGRVSELHAVSLIFAGLVTAHGRLYSTEEIVE